MAKGGVCCELEAVAQQVFGLDDKMDVAKENDGFLRLITGWVWPTKKRIVSLVLKKMVTTM